MENSPEVKIIQKWELNIVETFPQGFHAFLHVLWAAILWCLFKPHFQGCLYSKQPWKMEIASPIGIKDRCVCLYRSKVGQACLQNLIMNLGFKLRELVGYNANLLCIQYPLVSSYLSLEILRAKVNKYKHEIHIAFCAKSNKSFISDQGISRYLPLQYPESHVDNLQVG